MSLRVIIIRADGALADTDEHRRESCIQVFHEAGFDWTLSREEFAHFQAFSGEERMSQLVRRQLKRRPETDDLSQLIHAMQRRADKLFSERILSPAAGPRPGVRDLVCRARAENLRLMATSRLSLPDTQGLLRAVLGERNQSVFEVVTCHETEPEASLYQRLAERLALDSASAIVVEATHAGGAAARGAGLAALVTPTTFGDIPLASTDVLVVENLLSLIRRTDTHRLDPLSEDERTELLAALARLHASNSTADLDHDRRAMMRVADILKAKGTAVKTIEQTATIRALAHALKTEAVGVMVVMDKGGAIQGIISERDLASGIAEFGPELAAMRVVDLMTRNVVTCTPQDSVALVAKIMTQRRIRHLPVIANGNVTGLISIGDVLKHRLDEVQMEAEVLRDVARARW